MKDGFVKVCAVTPTVRVADCAYNAGQIIAALQTAAQEHVKVCVFPELAVTGYTCQDLFLQQTLLSGAEDALLEITKATESLDLIAFVGLPFAYCGKLYNVAAALNHGHVIGLVPKSNIPNYSEFYEARHFSAGRKEIEWVDLFGDELPFGQNIPFGRNILFVCSQMPNLTIGAEICEDLWVPVPPSQDHARAGATVIVNLSASDETTGKDRYRRELVSSQSARLLCGYIYADAGEGESTTDLVFAGHNLIGENGIILGETKRFHNSAVVSEIDVDRLTAERRRISTFTDGGREQYAVVEFSLEPEVTELTRTFARNPFVPSDPKEREMRCEEILNIQAMGLKKRLVHTGAKCAVVGVSGGLDSTLALLAAAHAFDLAGLDRRNLIGVTMPCFGTTDRTYQNAVALISALGATLREVPIRDAVKLHFTDIGHDPAKQDVTYENAQARERTQVLMDIANEQGGLVIGTGDLSELALGWATYNGDHMK